MKILVLEDDRLLNKAISYSLECKSHIVFSSFNGNEAVVILEKEAIDLIISDLMTPQRTGLNFLISLNKGLGFNTPTIIISGLIYAEKLIVQYNLNFVAFFKKPIDPQLIIDEANRISNEKN